MTRIPFVAGALAATLACAAPLAPALAADPDSGPYLGIGVNDSNFSITDDSGCWSYWYCGGEWSRNGDSDTGWTATAGWRVNRWFALEATYIDAGTPKWDDYAVYVPSLNGYYDVEADVDFKATEIAAIGSLPLGQIWDVYLRAGAARYDAESRQRAYDPRSNRVYTSTLQDSGTEFVFGIGAGVTFAPHARARLELRGMSVDRELLVEPSGRAQLLVVDLQLQYRF